MLLPAGCDHMILTTDVITTNARDKGCLDLLIKLVHTSAKTRSELTSQVGPPRGGAFQFWSTQKVDRPRQVSAG